MNSKTLWTRLLATTVMTAAGAFAAPAYSQTTGTDSPQAQDVGVTPDVAVVDDNEQFGRGDQVTQKAIVITGSRIAQPEVESSSPLVMTSDEEITLSGYTRVEEVLNNLPQVEAAQTSTIVNGATGTATLDLRGLGSVRTLVLVNGRRLQPGSINAIAADVNQIPSALVSRVEVVTGGGSSVYGSDAIAGVVNFIMNSDFEGIQLDVTGSGYLHNNRNEFISPLLAKGVGGTSFADPKDTNFDGTQWSVDLSMGSGFDGGRGHAVAYATYRKANELLQGSRDYAACALNAAGTACGGSSSAPIPNFYFFDDDQFEGPVPLLGNGNIGLNGEPLNIYNYAPVNHFQRPDERYTFGAFANYEINDSFNPYMEIMYMNDRTAAQIAESGTFYAFPYTIPCNSPLLTPTQGQQICGQLLGLNPATDSFQTYIGKRNTEGGPRINILQHDSWRAVVGTKGALGRGGWSYDTSLQVGQSSLVDVYQNDFFAPLVAEALDVKLDASGKVVCANPSSSNTGCVPYFVFTPGGVTPEAAQTLGATGIRTGRTKEYVATGYVTGDLGFVSPMATTPLAVVLGAEYRKEEYQAISDEVYEKGLLLGQGGPTPSVEGSFDLWEVFGETQLHLVEDASWARDLSLELGFRYSDYSTSGGAWTYKVAGNWEVLPQLRLRAAYNRAVRAPNAPELFSPSNVGLFAGEDPCAGKNPSLTQAQCALTGVSAAQYGKVAANPASQYNALYGGNLDLEPEVADTFTAGVLVTPMRNVRFSVDYYDINLDKVIGFYPQQALIEQCGLTGDAALCSRINRGPGGTLFLGQNEFVESINENLGGRRFRGIDVASDATFDVGAGRLSVDMNGSYLLEKTFEPEPNTPELTRYDCRGLFGPTCFPAPKWRHNVRLSYSFPEVWTVSGRWRYIGGVENEQLGDQPGIGSGTPSALNQQIDAQSYFDLVFQAAVSDNFTLTFGANNILDKEPPLIGGAAAPTNANTFAGFYDTLGRYVFGTASIRF